MNVKYCVCLFVFDENVRYHKKKEEKDKCQKPTKKRQIHKEQKTGLFFFVLKKNMQVVYVYIKRK